MALKMHTDAALKSDEYCVSGYKEQFANDHAENGANTKVPTETEIRTHLLLLQMCTCHILRFQFAAQITFTMFTCTHFRS